MACLHSQLQRDNGRDKRYVSPCQFSRKNVDQREQGLTIDVNPWVEKLLGRFGQYPRQDSNL